jgi:multimeric flavodoxin WrbA
MLIPMLTPEDLALMQMVNDIILKDMAVADEAAYFDRANSLIMGQAADLLHEYNIRSSHAINAAAAIESEHLQAGVNPPHPPAIVVAPSLLPVVDPGFSTVGAELIDHQRISVHEPVPFTAPAQPVYPVFQAAPQFYHHPSKQAVPISRISSSVSSNDRVQRKIWNGNNNNNNYQQSFYGQPQPQYWSAWQTAQPGYFWQNDVSYNNYDAYLSSFPVGRTVAQQLLDEDMLLRDQLMLDQQLLAVQTMQGLASKDYWLNSSPEMRQIFERDRKLWDRDQEIRKQLMGTSNGHQQQQGQQQQQQSSNSGLEQQQSQSQVQSVESVPDHGLHPHQLLALHQHEEYMRALQQAEQVRQQQQLMLQRYLQAQQETRTREEQMRKMWMQYLSSSSCNHSNSGQHQQQGQQQVQQSQQQQSVQQNQSQQQQQQQVETSSTSSSLVEHSESKKEVYESTRKEKERVRAALIDVLDDVS